MAHPKKLLQPNHTITLTVDAAGNFTYAPTLLRVARGETVMFQCNGQFEVMFKELSPGDKLYLWEGDPTLKINNNAQYGVYHYAAAVKTNNRVFLDSACGDIAVGT